jgi:hypothetical protein
MFSTEKIIKKSMIPSTLMAIGFARQTNIGLDKENFTEPSLIIGHLRKTPLALTFSTLNLYKT